MTAAESGGFPDAFVELQEYDEHWLELAAGTFVDGFATRLARRG